MAANGAPHLQLVQASGATDRELAKSNCLRTCLSAGSRMIVFFPGLLLLFEKQNVGPPLGMVYGVLRTEERRWSVQTF